MGWRNYLSLSMVCIDVSGTLLIPPVFPPIWETFTTGSCTVCTGSAVATILDPSVNRNQLRISYPLARRKKQSGNITE